MILALKELGYPNEKLRDTISWIRKCEDPSSGFNINPITIIEASLNYTYYGVSALLALGEKTKYSREILMTIKKFQNRNGGFRRYIRHGISRMENTYQAIWIAKNLGNIL
ncbi:MAG: prenyltransferase/squalene oxidase repeat-containing protein [Candidatus Asgardarchaeia archaeon]